MISSLIAVSSSYHRCNQLMYRNYFVLCFQCNGLCRCQFWEPWCRLWRKLWILVFGRR